MKRCLFEGSGCFEAQYTRGDFFTIVVLRPSTADVFLALKDFCLNEISASGIVEVMVL